MGIVGKMKKLKLLILSVLALVILGVLVLRADWVEKIDAPSFSVAPAVAKANPNPDYDLSSIVVMTRVISYIKNYYYDPGLVDPQKMFKGALEEVARFVPAVMVDFNDETQSVLVQMDTEQKVYPYADIDSVWKIQYRMADILRFLQPHLDRDIDPKDIEYAAINGMLSTLDPHSVHLSPRIYKELRLSTVGNFGGLGIQIGIREGRLTIVAPIKGTPAWRAGLKADDVIEKIDGQSSINMSLDEAVQLMRGKKGTPCILTIMRKGFAQSKDYNIVRDIIKIRSVLSELLPGNIGYIQVKNFQGNTVSDFKDQLSEMRRHGSLRGLILDLRGNPGGLLEAAVKMSDLFLDSGVIVTTVGAGNEPLDMSEASFIGTESKYPITVLIGSSSASASEIVAGALRNNNRAILIGDRTFGKGSVQVLYDMDDDSALKLTVAQYLTPGNVSIQSVGIVPDIELTPVRITEDFIDFYSSDRMRREKDLDRHLMHASVMQDKSFETLRYLYDEKRDEVDVDAPPDTVNTNDFTIQLAQKVLRKVGSISRREIILQRSLDVLKDMEKQEEAKMIREFKKLGIDWTLQKSDAPSTATVTASFNQPLPLEAGAEVEMVLKVANTGRKPLVRLRAITDSDSYIFDGVEFFFGLIKPGHQKEYKAKVTLPKDMDDRSDDVVFTFSEANGHAPDSLVQRVDVKGLKRPVFAYTFQVDDHRGNGDGLLQKGEEIDLRLDVENIGEGPALEGLAMLKNSDNIKAVFIEKGREEFKNLKPGERKSIAFKFKIQADLKEQNFPMEITIMDTDLREFVSESVTLHVQPALSLTPVPAGRVVKLTAGTTVFGSPDERLPEIATIGKDLAVAASALSGRWVRIGLQNDRIGWVLGTDAFQPQAGKAASPVLSMSHRSPQVTIENGPELHYTHKDRLILKGIARDDNNVQDLYILSNGKKVYFKSNKIGSDPLSMAFMTDIELEEGNNRIVIVARESDDFVGRKFLNVYRVKKPETTVSQAGDAAISPK